MNTRRNSPFYSTLSGLALQLGDRPLAHQLADQAVEASSATGWVKGYDGGTRLRAFEAMKQIEPALAMRRAFSTPRSPVATLLTLLLAMIARNTPPRMVSRPRTMGAPGK